MHATRPLLEQTDFPPIKRGHLDTLQVNVEAFYWDYEDQQTRCRSTWAIAATSSVCIAMSMRVRNAANQWTGTRLTASSGFLKPVGYRRWI